MYTHTHMHTRKFFHISIHALEKYCMIKCTKVVTRCFLGGGFWRIIFFLKKHILQLIYNEPKFLSKSERKQKPKVLSVCFFRGQGKLQSEHSTLTSSLPAPLFAVEGEEATTQPANPPGLAARKGMSTPIVSVSHLLYQQEFVWPVKF